MKRVTVSELKNRLSEFLRLVKRGETIEVLERSVPIARIDGLVGPRDLGEGQLKRLVFEGIVSRARLRPDLKLLEQPLLESSADPVRALVEGRGER